MKIAVATDDKVEIRRGFFGRSAYFLVVEVLNGVIVGKECRPNPYAADMPEPDGHGRTHTHKIIELLGDCQLFMGSSMAKEALPVLKAAKIDCIITSRRSAHEIVRGYLYGEDDGFMYFDPLVGDFRPCAQRNLRRGASAGQRG